MSEQWAHSGLQLPARPQEHDPQCQGLSFNSCLPVTHVLGLLKVTRCSKLMSESWRVTKMCFHKLKLPGLQLSPLQGICLPHSTSQHCKPRLGFLLEGRPCGQSFSLIPRPGCCSCYLYCKGLFKLALPLSL